jgi:hypothetical protein
MMKKYHLIKMNQTTTDITKIRINKNKIIIPIIFGQDQGEQMGTTFKLKTSSILAPVS